MKKKPDKKMFVNVLEEVEKCSKKFGGKEGKNYLFRLNFEDNPYFGFILKEEAATGVYHDFSLVITPNLDNPKKPWVISFGVGTGGFKNDHNLALKPGLRRLFKRIITQNNSYIKSDFSDIETKIDDRFIESAGLNALSEKYTKVMQCCELIYSPLEIDCKNNDETISDEYKKEQKYKLTKNAIGTIEKFIAAYAKIRGWNLKGNETEYKGRTKKIKDTLGEYPSKNQIDEGKEIDEITELVKNRKYVVLQGPPGTGKTRAANLIAKKLVINAKNDVVFIQFHAETTYSDFIYGIRPSLRNKDLTYEGKEGKLLEAINKAEDNPNTNVVLIIDEINRANLSNVLGPIFYLFEPNREKTNIEIELYKDKSISTLPENLYVIATMNTADRSLAVVDFALRRRFAWYDLHPRALDNKLKINEIDNTFFTKDFNRIAEIFEWHATSGELNLQPGQSYFIATDDSKMIDRIEYEIFPLIREYLQEGLLKSATDDLNSYFRERINKELFE